MITSERRQRIIKLLTEKSPMGVSEIIETLKAAPATIRRDLTYLERTGVIVRSRGAAQLSGDEYVSEFQARREKYSDEKLRIAKKAVELIAEGSSIILDSGTTTLALANQMVNMKDITVITNSLCIATALAHSKLSVLMPGGFVDENDMSLIGPDAERFYRGIEASTLFLSTTGIRGTTGLTTSSPFYASIKSAMVKAAQRVVLLADASKFNKPGVVLFADFSDIDCIITDRQIENSTIKNYFNQIGMEVITL